MREFLVSGGERPDQTLDDLSAAITALHELLNPLQDREAFFALFVEGLGKITGPWPDIAAWLTDNLKSGMTIEITAGHMKARLRAVNCQ